LIVPLENSEQYKADTAPGLQGEHHPNISHWWTGIRAGACLDVEYLPHPVTMHLELLRWCKSIRAHWAVTSCRALDPSLGLFNNQS
jgi:hypothetical protein